MKFTATAIFGLVALATAQNIADLPTCAQACALNSIASTGCGLTDVACICRASTFLTGVASCISTACTAAEQQRTFTFAQAFCASAGVTVSVPGGAPATSAAAGASASLASAISSATASATGSLASRISSVASAASSVSAVLSSASAVISSATAAANSTASRASSAAAAASTFRGAAPQINMGYVVEGLGFGAAMLAML